MSAFLWRLADRCLLLLTLPLLPLATFWFTAEHEPRVFQHELARNWRAWKCAWKLAGR